MKLYERYTKFLANPHEYRRWLVGYYLMDEYEDLWLVKEIVKNDTGDNLVVLHCVPAEWNIIQGYKRAPNNTPYDDLKRDWRGIEDSDAEIPL